VKRKVPWTTVVILVILMILGIGLPFWLEYQSLSREHPAPPPVRLEHWQ
jgi:hypothetical protein